MVFMSSREIANYLGCSEETARRQMNAGVFGVPFVIGLGTKRKHKRVDSYIFFESLKKNDKSQVESQPDQHDPLSDYTVPKT